MSIINRELLKKSLELYLVTDRHWQNGETLEEQVEQAILGGVTLVQLREKDLSYDEFLKSALSLKKITDKYNIPLIINDNVQIAKECDAYGVHIGQSDGSVSSARQILGKDKIIGVSAKTVETAQLAELEGADYIGCGAVFPTSSKDDVSVITHKQLRAVCDSVSIPVVAIGGISKARVLELKGNNIYGIAVISAILAEKDKRFSASELKKLTKELVKQ